MAKSAEDKVRAKREVLVSRTSLALGISEDEARRLLSIERKQGFRINQVKVRHPEIVLKQLSALGWEGDAFEWYRHGYTISGDKRQVSDSILAQEGAIYVQNAASWLPVLALDPKPGEKILDMCAAPGGKASHIMELTINQAEVSVNDNSRPRMSKMQANFKRLGVRPAETTLFDVSHIAHKLEPESFDKILLDAPCSGEGMMSLQNDKDFATWSVAHIRRLQTLQKRAISQAWQLLKPGGTLVYSTCTMAPEENEVVIDYALRKLEGSTIEPIAIELPNRVKAVSEWNNKALVGEVENCLRLSPSLYIEAFFVAKLTKPDS